MKSPQGGCTETVLGAFGSKLKGVSALAMVPVLSMTPDAPPLLLEHNLR